MEDSVAEEVVVEEDLPEEGVDAVVDGTSKLWCKILLFESGCNCL